LHRIARQRIIFKIEVTPELILRPMRLIKAWLRRALA